MIFNNIIIMLITCIPATLPACYHPVFRTEYITLESQEYSEGATMLYPDVDTLQIEGFLDHLHIHEYVPQADGTIIIKKKCMPIEYNIPLEKQEIFNIIKNTETLSNAFENQNTEFYEALIEEFNQPDSHVAEETQCVVMQMGCQIAHNNTIAINIFLEYLYNHPLASMQLK